MKTSLTLLFLMAITNICFAQSNENALYKKQPLSIDLAKEVQGTYIVKVLEEYTTGRTSELPSRGISMYYNVSRLDSTTVLITQGGTRYGKDFQSSFKAKLSTRNNLIIFDEIWEFGDLVASGKFEGERIEEINKYRVNNKPHSKSIGFR